VFERPIFVRLRVLNGIFPNPLLCLFCYVALRVRFAPFPDLAKKVAAVPVRSRNSALACHGLVTLWQKQFRTAISTFPAIFLCCPSPHFREGSSTQKTAAGKCRAPVHRELRYQTLTNPNFVVPPHTHQDRQ